MFFSALPKILKVSFNITGCKTSFIFLSARKLGTNALVAL